MGAAPSAPVAASVAPKPANKPLVPSPSVALAPKPVNSSVLPAPTSGGRRKKTRRSKKVRRSRRNRH